MSRFYCITIPVKMHIQKFFTYTEGNPIRSGDESMFWLTLRPYLMYKSGDSLSLEQRQKQISNLKGKLTIALSTQKVKVYGLAPRPSAIILINRVLDHYFGKELFWYIQKCEKNPGRYKGFKKAINDFCVVNEIEIEEDISLAALLNLYQRHRKYRKRIGAEKLSPAFMHN